MTLPHVLERDWQAKVIEAAKLFGWRWAHFRPDWESVYTTLAKESRP